MTHRVPQDRLYTNRLKLKPLHHPSQDVSYTNWKTGQPDNWGSGEDGIVILQGSNGLWGDVPITNEYRFVCIYNIKSDNAGKHIILLGE